MDCPYCNRSISIFSREMSRFGKVKACPHCQKPIKLFLSPKHAAIFFVPTIAVALLLRPWLGSLATGLAVGFMIALSMRLKPVT